MDGPPEIDSQPSPSSIPIKKIYHKGRIDSSLQEPVQKADSKNPGNGFLGSGLAQSYAS
jgi:hypothetical protein